MSLTRMGKDAETVRFLDDIDATLSLDSRATESHQMMSIEATSQPIVFRASYRDINLITTIVNKAITLYTESTQKQSNASDTKGEVVPSSRSTYHRSVSRNVAKASARSQPVGKANVILSKEQVRMLLAELQKLADKRTSSARLVKASGLF